MTRKSFSPAAWALPLPVSIIGTWNEDGSADAMNAAWTGQYDSTQIILCLSESHKTYKNIKRTGEFTVSYGTVDQATPCDYVGIVSGNIVADKVSHTGWTVSRAEKVNAPVFAELPMTLECKLAAETDNGNLIADIVSITCDESCLDEDGKPDLDKIGLLTFDATHNTYRKLGNVVAKAWDAGMKLK